MSGIRRHLQITFVTGLLVIIPIALPVWVFWELFTILDRLLAPLIGDTFSFHIPGLGLLVATLLVLLMGIFAPNVVGRRRAAGEPEPLVAVYVPTNHLYLGDILLVRREDIILTRLTVPQGIQIILSGGISLPQVL